MALFISFEGGEGSGKSTQAGRLVRALNDMGVPTQFIHEPGTTNLGRHIRELIKGRPWGRETISHEAELFLFSAARAELAAKVLSKASEETRLVIVADRYVDSTVAYQGYGRRLPLDLMDSVNRLATQEIMPDLTLLLDCPPAEALKRVGQIQAGLFDDGDSVRMDEAGARRFEDEPLAFHRRVRSGYLKLAGMEPERWLVLDGTKDEDAVFGSVWEAVTGMEKFRRVVEQSESSEEHRAPEDLGETTLFPLSGSQRGC